MSSKKKVAWAMPVVISLVLIALFGPSGASGQGGADCIQLYVNGTLVFESSACNVVDPTPTSTPQPTLTPTKVIQPTPTNTPVPATSTPTITATVTVTPTLQPTPTPTPSGGASDKPLCAEHDPRAFHTLEAQDCHYDHPHGDDPHLVDDIFGTEYFNFAGGEISYQWQTPNENIDKHKGYIWQVGRDLECFSDYTDGCFTDYRVQFHGMQTAHGAVTNFHSAMMQARICNEAALDRCGRVFVGFTQGPVDLAIGVNPDGSPFIALDRPQNVNRSFIHYNETAGNPDYGTWYTGHRTGVAGVIPQFEDMWQLMPQLHDADAIKSDATLIPGNNGSIFQTHVLQFGVPARWRQEIPVDNENRLNFTGFMYTEDPYVDIAPHDGTWLRGYRLVAADSPECIGGPSPNCQPLVIDGVPAEVGLFQYRGGSTEYDVCFNTDGTRAACANGGSNSAGWIVFPEVGER